MKDLSVAILTIVVFYVLPFGLVYSTAERAEITDHTEISAHPGDNYAVFKEGRYIQIITGLFPALIRERDDRIVRVNYVGNQRGCPMAFYSPASAAEEALWHRYFR